jgi:hypothetical protein
MDRAPQGPDSNTLLAEQRTAIRYAVRLHVAFRWTDGRGLRRQAEGQTRDLSPKGAYVLAANCPPCGAKVQIEIELSTAEQELRTLRLGAECSVLRVESSRTQEQGQGFAIQIRRARFLTQ